MVKIDERFSVGQRVEALCVVANKFRLATLIQHAPYPGGKTDGYYVSWILPADAPSWVSRGGWMPVSRLRTVEA